MAPSALVADETSVNDMSSLGYGRGNTMQSQMPGPP